MRLTEVATFPSQSSPGKFYAVHRNDTTGELSCNCPGWTRRIKNGVRTCRHVVEVGNTMEFESAARPVRVARVREVMKVIEEVGRGLKPPPPRRPAPASTPASPPVMRRRGIRFD